MTTYLSVLNKLPRYRATVEHVSGRYEGTMRKSKNGPYVLLSDVISIGGDAFARGTAAADTAAAVDLPTPAGYVNINGDYQRVWTADIMRTAITPYAEHIRLLERELATLRPAQSIDTPEFIRLATNWSEVRELNSQDDKYEDVRQAWAALIAYIDGHTAGTAWISVDDRLPAKSQQVIAFRPTAVKTQDPPISLVRYTASERESWQGVKHGFDCICHPTHWMPLPAAPSPLPPKEEDK